jgi:DNA-directed RNA polymerase subunit L
VVTLLIPYVLAKAASVELERYQVDHTRLHTIHLGTKTQSKDTGLMSMEELVVHIQEVVKNVIAVWPKLTKVCHDFCDTRFCVDTNTSVSRWASCR